MNRHDPKEELYEAIISKIENLAEKFAAVDKSVAEGARLTELVREPVDIEEGYESLNPTTGEALYDLLPISQRTASSSTKLVATMRTLWCRVTRR